MTYTRKNNQTVSEVADSLKNKDNFLVTTHSQPDGDAIGAVLAFGMILKHLGKKAVLAVEQDDVPPQYRFLPGTESFVSAEDADDFNVFVALDAANRERLGPLVKMLDTASFSINIDHHPDNSNFADLNWLNGSASSVSEQIFDLWQELDFPLDEDAAVCIYVGMLTDTGRWQYANTTAKCLRIAAQLVEAGVRPVEIYYKIYENYSVEWLKLLAVGLSRTVYDGESGLAYTLIKQEDLHETGASMAETENLVDWLRSVGKMKVALVLKETGPGRIKASMRSRAPYDVGRLARELGGGGHENASGFVSTDRPDVIVDKIKRWLTAFS